MSGATFDTLKFVETLQEAGIPETHAKAISNAVRSAYDTAERVTKSDLREAVSEVRAEMQRLGSDLRSDIQRLDSRRQARTAVDRPPRRSRRRCARRLYGAVEVDRLRPMQARCSNRVPIDPAELRAASALEKRILHKQPSAQPLPVLEVFAVENLAMAAQSGFGNEGVEPG